MLFQLCKRGDSNFSAVTLWTETYSLTIQMKAIEQYFAVVLFIMQNEAIRTFDTGEKSKFPQIFYHGICMDIINSTVHEKPNKDILWFFVGQ